MSFADQDNGVIYVHNINGSLDMDAIYRNVYSTSSSQYYGQSIAICENYIIIGVKTPAGVVIVKKDNTSTNPWQTSTPSNYKYIIRQY